MGFSWEQSCRVRKLTPDWLWVTSSLVCLPRATLNLQFVKPIIWISSLTQILTIFVSRSQLLVVIWPASTSAYILGTEWLRSHYSVQAVICFHLAPMCKNSGTWYNIYDTKLVGVNSELRTDSPGPGWENLCGNSFLIFMHIQYSHTLLYIPSPHHHITTWMKCMGRLLWMKCCGHLRNKMFTLKGKECKQKQIHDSSWPVIDKCNICSYCNNNL